jgi:hypothetical protein
VEDFFYLTEADMLAAPAYAADHPVVLASERSSSSDASIADI